MARHVRHRAKHVGDAVVAQQGARLATLLHVGAAVGSVVVGLALAQHVIFYAW